MKSLLLLTWMPLALFSQAVPTPSQVPRLPPIRWGLWEGRVEGMPGMDDGPSVTRSCVSAATWKGFMDTHGDDSYGCVWSNQVATEKTYSADMSCAKGKITGHGEMTIDSPESFHYKMSIDMSQDQSHPRHFDVSASGKFISTSCAGLKPGEDIDVWE